MTAAVRLRGLALPILAVLLVTGVLAVQLGNGGGHYSPPQSADSCVAKPVRSTSPGIDGLTDELVLTGLDAAACQAGVSREVFALQLALPGAHSDLQINRLRTGLLIAVDRLQADGMLPKASQLAHEVVDDSDLSGLRKTAIRAIPDSLIDKALKTDDVLRRTINNLDLRALLTNTADRRGMTTQVDAAVLKAVLESLAL